MLALKFLVLASLALLDHTAFADVKIFPRNQLKSYEGEEAFFNCTRTDMTCTSDRPVLAVTDNPGATIAKPSIDQTHPNCYTAEATIPMTRAFNSINYELKCQNTPTPNGATDLPYSISVYFLDIKAGKSRDNNRRDVPNHLEGVAVDCRHWFTSNHNIEYSWTGEIAKNNPASQPYLQILPTYGTGTKTAVCTAVLEGDVNNVSAKQITFTFVFSPNPNNAGKLSAYMLSWVTIAVIWILR